MEHSISFTAQKINICIYNTPKNYCASAYIHFMSLVLSLKQKSANLPHNAQTLKPTCSLLKEFNTV